MQTIKNSIKEMFVLAAWLFIIVQLICMIAGPPGLFELMFRKMFMGW